MFRRKKVAMAGNVPAKAKPARLTRKIGDTQRGSMFIRLGLGFVILVGMGLWVIAMLILLGLDPRGMVPLG